MQARMAAHRPKTVAQACKCWGYQRRNTLETTSIVQKWNTHVRTTNRAVRQVGGAGESEGWGSGPGCGKNMRNKNILNQCQ
jgi:hypothetical protein